MKNKAQIKVRTPFGTSQRELKKIPLRTIIKFRKLLIKQKVDFVETKNEDGSATFLY